jgi:SAM-dependent methyltransferase
VHELTLEGTNFEVLEEILVKAYTAGWRVCEIPFTYYPRERGSSHARIVQFGIALLRAFFRLRTLRHSVESADHDERAFYSPFPARRWWERARHERICAWTRGAGKTLDVGCGSRVILQSINDVVGVDTLHNTLRYMRRYDVPLVRGAPLALPVRDETFDCVVCAGVLDRVPSAEALLAELRRVLRPGGLLVLGTDDRATLGWQTVAWLHRVMAGTSPRSTGAAHTRDGLLALCRQWGFTMQDSAYVFGIELLIALRKGRRDADRLEPHRPADAAKQTAFAGAR